MDATSKRKQMRPKPLFHLLPNMLTVMGLCAGLTGMRYALDQRWELAVGLIVAAAILDGLDGRSARLLKLESKLGEQLDSLADFLSFGVAPAVIIYLWVLHDVRAVGWALAMLFATCCAMRLARFNAELDDPSRPAWMSKFFTGIPAPAAAGMALLPIISSFVVGDDIARSWFVNAAMFLFVAVMMVSRVPTYSAKRVRIQPAFVVPVLIAGGMFLVFLVTETWATLMAVGLLYTAALPVAFLHARKLAARVPKRTRPETETASQPEEAADEPAAAGASEEPSSDDDRVVPIDKKARS